MTHAFRDFIRFFFADIDTEIDWSKPLRFRDKELAGISFGGTPDGLIADKLVEVSLRDGAVGWVLIHIEIQAQHDALMASRVFDYNYRIRKEYQLPVASLVLLADKDPSWRPEAFYSKVPGTVMAFSFSTAKLLDYTGRTDELLASDNPFAFITLAHLRTQQAGHDADKLYAAKWQLTKRLFQHGWHKERIIVLFKVINGMMVLPAAYQRRYWYAVIKLEKERKMEWITPLEQMFIDDGRQKGAATIIERLLTRRFGPLPKTVRKKLQKASMAQLEAWSDVLSDAQSLKQVFNMPATTAGLDA